MHQSKELSMKVFWDYWNRFVEPSPLITDLEDQRRARFFSALMLILFGVTGIFVIWAEIFTVYIQGLASPLPSNMAAVTVMFVGYIISRSKYYKFAALIFIFILSL